jgi:predicted PurR-regulated permease PerM
MQPLTWRITQALFIPILITVILYFGKPALVPVTFAILLAMLMAPLCRWFDSKGWSRGLSCFVCVLVVAIFISLIFLIVGLQISGLVENMDKMKEKAQEIWAATQQQIEQWFSVTPEKQEQVVDEQVEQMKKSSSGTAGKIIGGLTGTIGGIVIVLVFTFLLLYHKEKYQQFFLKLFATTERNNVKKTLEEITHVSQQYLKGRILSVLFLFILYAVALLTIGIENAIILSAIAAVLTIIPYVGSIAGGLLPFMAAAVTEDSIQPAVWVLVAIVIIQAIDNYFIEPNVIGGEVGLSAFATILAILVGGLVWGVAGMMLFIPLISIVKIICDHVDALKPWGYVLGDEGKSTSSKILDWFKKKKK